MKTGKRHGTRRTNIFTVLGVLLIFAALALTAYNMWVQQEAAETSREALAELTPVIRENAAELRGNHTGAGTQAYVPDYMLSPDMDMPTVRINGQKYIGVLQIPALDLELPVMSGWSYAKLRIAPCQYSGTAYQNDMILCGHNYDKHFGRLKDMPLGTPVDFVDADGNIFHYETISMETLGRTAVEDLMSGDWDLTLFTCTIGGATRVVVRCALYNIELNGQISD